MLRSNAQKIVKYLDFSCVANGEKRPHAGRKSPKISLYGIENCDYTANQLTVFSSLPLSDRIKIPRLTGSNLIQFLAK
jgi:hypothetical protein